MTRTGRAGLVAILLLAVACRRHESTADATRAGEGVTRFGEDTELFVEFRALVVGVESSFAAHVTRLDTFKPLAAGRVTVVLAGGGAPEERFAIDAPSVPGIFRPVAVPRRAGSRAITVLIDGEGLSDRHELGTFQVFADLPAAQAAKPEEKPEAPAITFLKEQQWRIPFATAAVTERPLRPSFRVHGVLRARADGEARLAAPVTGRLVTDPAAAPMIGMTVTRETVLAAIAPRLSVDTDPVELERAVSRARRDLDLARKERARLEELYRGEAVPERRLREARHGEQDAEADLEAAIHRLQQHQGIHRATGSEPAGGIMLRSPISGTLVQVRVAPGEFVEEGRALFDVVDLDRLWLEAHIPEASIAHARAATGAWFEVDGFPTPFEVDASRGGRVISRGGVVDPESRTTTLILEVPNTDHVLAVGMFAHVHVLTGESVTGPAVPTAALVDDAGQSVVYVERGGESFERRPLTLGVRDGDFVQVVDGLAPGERVVTRGASYIRLASASGAVPAHGHAH